MVLASTPIDLAIPAMSSAIGKSIPRYRLSPSASSTEERYLSRLSFRMRYDRLLQTTYTTGMPSLAAVQKPWTVIIALPSPTTATTGRSGLASLTPIAAPTPQPRAPPRPPYTLPGVSKSMESKRASRVVTASSMTIVSGGRADATSAIMRDGGMGEPSQPCLTRRSRSASIFSLASAKPADRPLAASFAEPDIAASSASARRSNVTAGSAAMPTSVGWVAPTSAGSESTWTSFVPGPMNRSTGSENI